MTYLKWIIGLSLAALLFIPIPSLHSHKSYNWGAFGRIPVLHAGRVKPLESVARLSLIQLSGKQTIRFEKKQYEAIEWLACVFWAAEKADKMPVFRIYNPNIVALMGIEGGKKKLFSFQNLQGILPQLDREAQRAEEMLPAERTSFQKDILILNHQLLLYAYLKYSFDIPSSHIGLWGPSYWQLSPQFSSQAVPVSFFESIQKLRFMTGLASIKVLPPVSNQRKWHSFSEGLLTRLLPVQKDNPVLKSFLDMAVAYQANRSDSFNQALERYQQQLKACKSIGWSVKLDYVLLSWAPFYRAMLVYCGVFTLVFFAWLLDKPALIRIAYRCATLSFFCHSVGIVMRMLVMGRPPVTNLYTSAVCVGWVGVGVALYLEKGSKKGIGLMVAGMMGFLSLIISHHLALQGDTMEMLQAVLDSNFWLSTHVVTVTIGYGATFLAGFLAHVYIVRAIFSSSMDTQTHKSMGSMVYGTICFGLLFSFLGTVLGGIWADQSWGRFWGWDPKENGALMIVLWNAIILHARWAGFIRIRGIMILAILGNCITAFSWFGVNMLGVGLHSYGFMDRAFFWLIAFVASQLAMVWLALLPKQYWKSIRKKDVPNG